jgi:hypothetical protein
MAAKTLAASGVHAVLICQQRNALERFIWLEHANRHRAHHARVAALAVTPEVCKEIVPACEIEFLGGFYRFPLPRCQVWSVHLQQSGPRLLAITKELLRIARVSPGDSALLGLSLYRAVGLPAGLWGFLALTPGHDPAELLATRWGDHPPDVLAHAEWQALQVRWTGGHTDSGTSPVAISSSRYPRAAFWARSHAGPGLAHASVADRSPASHRREVDT